jgi:hypothetical protein
MAMKACSECKKEISTDANPCPHCGKKNPHGSSKGALFGGTIVALIGGFWFLGGGAQHQIESQAKDELVRIHNQVAQDAVAQFEIAKRSGDKMQTCAHAGMVSAAFLQSKDETSYRKWQAIEKQECVAAGVPR